MQIENKVVRPKFDVTKVDRTNVRFKKLVDDYARWNADDGDGDTDREEYESDILACLSECNLDGYELATFLKDKVWLSPDSQLVDILDDVQTVKRSFEQSMLLSWVKDNSLEIPADVVGKKVNAKQSCRTYENYYITGIRSESFCVTIDGNSDKKGGFIIDFENVTFI